MTEIEGLKLPPVLPEFQRAELIRALASVEEHVLGMKATHTENQIVSVFARFADHLLTHSGRHRAFIDRELLAVLERANIVPGDRMASPLQVPFACSEVVREGGWVKHWRTQVLVWVTAAGRYGYAASAIDLTWIYGARWPSRRSKSTLSTALEALVHAHADIADAIESGDWSLHGSCSLV